ncbi:aldo/keto reductase [Agreia pratensis]|uniref:Aldo/keto reductase n=1 Tax=Agreia pratensis TaxID=150121 RepID=A0A1X7K7H2_9MICO|nr:aldo/keto reductase [Agreia pratensis]MBF4634295.1 aldo/keto reductase [Agreia pratensis]SMG36654.1 Aldo/keto reductase [Agreia pratensis]
MTIAPTHLLADGNTLPALGLGTYPLTGAEAVSAVSSGLAAGYRLIDSAVNYGNEDAVGEAVRKTDVPRDEIVVTTKLPGRAHGYESTLASFQESLDRLGLERIDLYLIHWPNPGDDRYVDSWRAMVHLHEQGLARTIGVSNFTEEYLTRLQSETGVLPAVNQIELHPYFPQLALLEFHEVHNIRTESWSPLGKGSDLLTSPVIVDAARAHGVTEAQVVLRWHVQLGSVPLPKSADPARQIENLEVFGFDLSPAEMEAITLLGRPDGRLFGADPVTHNEQ